jgi:TolB protein
VFLGLLAPAACGDGEEASTTGLPVGKIAFSSRRDGNGEIYLLTRDGETNLTNNPAEDIESDLSPDGDKIIFASNREGTYHIYLANADGGGLTKLTDEAAGDFSPRWSPDGKLIAFSRTGSLMVMEADGENVREVTKASPEANAGPCEAGAFLGGWSPDGQQLVFYAASVTQSAGQICAVNIDGSDLTVVANEPPGWHVEPSWSPDGEWIAYRFIDPDTNNYEIYKVRPDGTSRINLTSDPAMDLEPYWSPDGKWIVFGSNRSGDFDLYMMEPDGSGVAQLTTTAGKDSDPSWGP